MQALNIAQREGLKIPLSDKPVSDFDLVKAFQEREKEKQQEVERIKEAAELKSDKGRGIQGLVVGKCLMTVLLHENDEINIDNNLTMIKVKEQ